MNIIRENYYTVIVKYDDGNTVKRHKVKHLGLKKEECNLHNFTEKQEGE